MNRRCFLLSLVRVAPMSVVLANPGLSWGLLRCSDFAQNGVQQCEAGLDSKVIGVAAAAVNGQHMNQWCWAASIETIFRYYGYIVPQELIVQQTWGAIVNLPGQPNQIMNDLNKVWVDKRGRRFKVSGNIFSANHMTAAEDLSKNRPLIIGTLGHAMVLTSLTYVRDANGRGNVTAATVRDPWPGKGKRILTAQEWYNTSFLARVRVSKI